MLASVWKSKTRIVVLVLTVLGTGTLLADRVELKTGEVFFGEILRADKREVSVRLNGGGVISFRMNKVSYFRKNFVVPDEWVPTPVLEIDSDFDIDTGPELLTYATSFQGSPSPSSEVKPTKSGISLNRSAPLDSTLVHDLVTDTTNGFQVAPPRGLLTWEKGDDPSVIGYYYDPVTQANLNIVALEPSSESIEVIKKKTSRSYAKRMSSFKVVRDQPLRDVPYDGWLFEVKVELAGVEVHQLHVFAKTRGKSFSLTYSTSIAHFPEFSSAFAESIRSFTFNETVDDKAGASDADEGDDSAGTGGPVDLLKLLHGDGRTSGAALDKFLWQGEADQ